MISPSESTRILGIIFQNNLRWTKHINKCISSANSMFLSIKYISKFLTKNQLRTAINAHFVSKLTFASTVWNKVITSKERKKLSVNLNRVARLLCPVKAISRNKKISNKTLYETSGLRSLTSLCTIADCSMLYRLCTGLNVEPLCERLLSQCHTNDRYSKKLHFFNYSRTKIGCNSFVNRSKFIAELLTFDWLHLNPLNFKLKLCERAPFNMK